MSFISFILGVVIVFMLFDLRRRVTQLEGKTLKDKSFIPLGTPESIQISQRQAQTQVQAQTQSKKYEPDAWDRFIAWIKEDWLVKLGAMLLLIGFGWLASYAFLNNWIGPAGRILLGIVGGSLFIILGFWRIKSFTHQGGIFLVLGSTTILLTVFAARNIYGFFTPLSALLVMFLSAAFVAFASVQYRSRSLALSSIVLAGIAPLLTNSPVPSEVGLFSYLLVIVLGVIWIVGLTGQRELTAAALILVTFYSLGILPGSDDRDVLLLFAYAFSAIFFLANTAGILKLKDREIIPDIITAAGNGIFLLTWIMVAADDEWKSLIISAWMIVFVVGAFLIFRSTSRHEPFYVYAGVGLAMLAAATSAELSGATLTIAYAIESGLISLVTYFVLRDVNIAERMSLLLVGPAVLSIGSIMSSSWSAGVIHKDFFVLAIMSLIFFSLGLFFKDKVKDLNDKDLNQFNAALLIVGSAYLYILLWLSLNALEINKDTAVMIALVIYTIVGLGTYFYGRTNAKHGMILYGGTLLGFVVVRLLFIEVWSMALSGKIITFFMIGALLISTAFVGRTKNGQ